MNQKPDKPLIHASQINMYYRCGVQFQRRFGERFGVWHKEEKVAPGFALAVGSATHQSIDQNMSYKLKHGELLDVLGVEQIAVDAATKILDGELFITADERRDFENLKGKAIDQAAALAKLHHTKLAPIINPTEVEWEWVLDIKNYPLGLAGAIDLVEIDGIRDTKTTAQTPQPNAIYTIPMGIYAIAYKHHKGKLPEKIAHDYLVKTKQPKAVTHDGPIKQPWLDATMMRLKRMIETIDAVKEGKDVFSPARPDDWVCSPRFCGYYADCPFKSGRE